MTHIHFDTIESTQTYLIDEHNKGSDTHLVTSKLQTQGYGRKRDRWDCYENSLSFSFKISPNPIASLTPLEIGVLLCQFFKNQGIAKLSLKWPNDILTSEGLKCGGIIANLIDNSVIVGVGINYGSSKGGDHYKTKKGTVSNILLTQDCYKEIPLEIFKYISRNRISQNLTGIWNSFCSHQNQEVEILDTDTRYSGVFKGISQYGEAILETNGEETKYSSGSLFILN